MKKAFKDPAEIKKHEPRAEPKDGKNSPWDFRCPDYDQRSSCFVNAGTNYGVGINQPVGHSGNAKMRDEGIMPTGTKCMVMDEN
jgi:hypothetical protein